VLESVKAGRQPRDWTPEALAAFHPAFTAEMAKFLDPAEGVRTRTVPGGTAPAAVNAALRQARERLEKFGQ
jgi:argininosuccinate lyase